MSQDTMDPEIYADFVIEAREHLETIEPALLRLEKTPDNLKILDEIFRPMHSLKGASGFLGLGRMNRLAHKGESVLDELRKGKMRVTAKIMDLILKTTDMLKEMIDTLESSGSEGEPDIEHLLESLDALLAGPEDQAETVTGAAGVAAQDPALRPYILTIASEEHLSDFLEEAHEIIGNLNQALVSAEKNPEDTELINNLFRSFHNMKGNAGIIGYAQLSDLSHEAETLLNGVRKGDFPLTREAVDALLLVVDGMEALLKQISPSSGEVRPISIDSLVTVLCELHGVRPTGKPAADQGSQAAPGADADDLDIFEQTVSQQLENISMALDSLSKNSAQQDSVDALYRSLSSLKNSAAYMGLDDLHVYADRTAGLVKQARDADLDFAIMLDMLGQEAKILEEMVAKALDALRQAPRQTPKPAPAARPAPAPAPAPISAPAPASASQPDAATSTPEPLPVATEPAASKSADLDEGKTVDKKKTASTIRVDHAKLDHLMNLIGELIINRNRFAMLAKGLEAGENPHTIAHHLMETTYSMNRISDDLQDTIMNVRMVPVQTVFSKFPRLIRDLSRKSGKQVELFTEGEETELDKSVVEVIGDPLVHLLRNSVDHGLESEEVRLSMGKPAVGQVWLRAFHKGNSVLIEVEDDGKGIDPDVMRRKAVEKGLISSDDAKNMDDRTARELIFAPGFSTAAQVTDISGRGVGMDVVRSNIKDLKGSVNVQSEVGKGTKFTLTLPLTLAIIDALMVRVGNDTYAIPLDSVSETTKIPAAKVSAINKNKATTLRGDVLGLANLGELLGVASSAQGKESLPVVVMSLNDLRLGLIVDQLMQRQDVVIKSMGDYLGDIQGVSGATIMGDGRVILILDPHEIYRMATDHSLN